MVPDSVVPQVRTIRGNCVGGGQSSGAASFDMTDLLEQFARQHPEDVVERGDIFVSAAASIELIDEAERRGVVVLGLEGFLVDGEDIYPSLDRIADFSNLGEPADRVARSAAQARQLLTGPWRLPPGPDDQMHADAKGRHMIVVCLAD